MASEWMLPSVAELLEVDREYRRKAKGGVLQLIAPRKFNPTGEAWLPILHTVRGDRKYTALFSNTERAQRLGMTHDWVVIFSKARGGDARPSTVVTEFREPLRGKRVVRGREFECAEYYGVETQEDEEQLWLEQVVR